jgi:hypothetical protein
MRIISKKNHRIWLGRSLGTWNDFGAVVLLEEVWRQGRPWGGASLI